MTASFIKLKLKQDPNFAINAVLDNNAHDVATKLNAMGFSVSEEKEQIMEALAEIASGGDYASFQEALMVPVQDQHLTDPAYNAIFGAQPKNEPVQVTQAEIGFPRSFQTIEPTFDPDGYGNVNDLLDGLNDVDGGQGPAETGSGNGIDWGSVLNSVLPSIFDLFGGNGNDGNGPNQDAYAIMMAMEQQRAERQRKIILWFVIILILAIIGVVAYKSMK